MKTIGNKNVSYTTYDINNPIDVAYSIMDDKDGEKISTIREITFCMWNYCTKFGQDVLRAIGLFAGHEYDSNEKFRKCFDKWCEDNKVKVFDKCKKCGKEIYVFDMWGTRTDSTSGGYCYKCEQELLK